MFWGDTEEVVSLLPNLGMKTDLFIADFKQAMCRTIDDGLVESKAAGILADDDATLR
jgi:hypothetical protein